MNNFIQKGDTVTVVAPTGGVSSGDGVMIGSLFGVAKDDAAAAANVEIVRVGVVRLPKLSTDTLIQGQLVHWDDTLGHITETTADLDGMALVLVAAGAGILLVDVILVQTE